MDFTVKISEMSEESLNESGSVDDVQLQIKNLEKKIASELLDIADTIEKKYVKCIPEICTSNELLNDIRQACASAEAHIVSIYSSIKRLEEGMNENADVLIRLKTVEECKAKMSYLENIESLISQLWYSPNEKNPLVNARLIAELERSLNSIFEKVPVDGDIFTERICPALRDEVVELRQNLILMLNKFWENFLVYQEGNGSGFILQVPTLNSELVSKNLSALDLLGALDDKLTKFGAALMRYFCHPIITASYPSEVFKYREVTVIVNPRREYQVKMQKTENQEEKTAVKPEAVFETLLQFFTFLHGDFKSFKVGETDFVVRIGNKIFKDLVEMLVKECLTPAVPSDPEKLPNFQSLIEQAESLIEKIKSLGFFTNEGKSFKEFAESYEETFLNRRCQKILMEARELIEAPFTDLVTVGRNKEVEQESIEEFRRLALSPPKKSDADVDHYPKLLQILECQVSATAVKYGELLSLTLNAAVNADSPVTSSRMLQLARSLVELHLLLAPHLHQVQISSVPLLAAVFYNNCYYMCHYMMTVSTDALQKLNDLLLKKSDMCITFADFVPRFRKLAADSLEKQLSQCRRQLSTMLADDRMFTDLHNPIHHEKCSKCLNGCMMELEQISAVWKGVLTETVYALSLGNLTSFFFTLLVKIILSSEDIKERDAELTTTALKEIIRRAELLFVIGSAGHSCIHQFVELPLFRIKEILFCLDSSMQGIYDRWCDGKGPLAQWLETSEVRHLIKALFQNTEKRKYVLSKIN